MSKIAFLMDKISSIRTLEDTTSLLIMEAGKRGHRVLHLEPEDLTLDSKKGLLLSVKPVTVDEIDGIRPIGPTKIVPLNYLDCLWIRKDPPFNLNYYHFLLLLSLFETNILMINRPSSLLLGNEKLLPFLFPKSMPKTVITHKKADLAIFLKSHRKAVWKPLEERSGNGIMELSKKLAHYREKRWGLAQEFLPAIKTKDNTRVFLLNEHVLSAYTRIPPKGKWLIAPIHEDGPIRPATLKKSEIKTLHKIGTHLRNLGFYFAGIDLIGGKITEINVTSPGGLTEANLFHKGMPLEKKVLDFVERNLKS
jgi:glutathione synthase